MADKSKKPGTSDGVLATNRKAFRDFHVLEKFEAGIELRGTEVKSIRDGHIRIDEAYAHIENGQAEVLQMTVQPYSHGNVHNHSPTRPRRPRPARARPRARPSCSRTPRAPPPSRRPRATR